MFCVHALLAKGTNPFRLAPVPRSIWLQAVDAPVEGVEVPVVGPDGLVVPVEGSEGLVVPVEGSEGLVAPVEGDVVDCGALSFTIV